MECTVIISEVEEILPRSNGKIPILLEVGRDCGHPHFQVISGCPVTPTLPDGARLCCFQQGFQENSAHEPSWPSPRLALLLTEKNCLPWLK